MSRPQFSFQLDSNAKSPLFLQIAEAIVADIRRGRLAPGARLPGSRRLAESLRVHRNTVVAALAELEQQGWVEARPRRGCYVSASLPPANCEAKRRGKLSSGLPTSKPQPQGIRWGFPESAPPKPHEGVPPGVLELVGGCPDLRLVPKKELARAMRRALLTHSDALAYGSPWGHPRIRWALCEFLAETRAIVCSPPRICMTSGSQMAIFLAARALLSPGARVGVEAYGYGPAWQALRMCGAELVPIAVDASGLRVDALRAACDEAPLRAVYVTPHHQYPTTVTLTAPRRQQLLALARERGFAIVEDDYDHEQHYAGRPVLPLASQDPDGVLYVGTLSKVLAPGLRLGYLVGPEEVIERVGRLRAYVDHQGSHALELALAEWIEEGELRRHTRRIARHYRERRETLASALKEELGGELRFALPPGGMALWARARTSTEPWARRALAAGVLVHAGRRYRFDGAASSHLRLGFGALQPAEIREAVRRLAKARVAGA